MKETTWKLNTSNMGKFEEFKRLFAKYGYSLETSHVDLREIDANPIQVVTHKASQLGDNVLVEDTSLEIENTSVGIHVRWLLDHLPQYVGQQATWIALLAYRMEDKILIYQGSVSGMIVKPTGTGGFGFDPVFLPTGAVETLAQSKPDHVNARAKAVDALMKGEIWMSQPVMEQWMGPWQHGTHEHI